MRVTWYIKNTRANRLARFRKSLGMNSYNYDRFLTSTWNRCLQLIPYLENMNIECRVDSGNNLNTDIAVIMRWQDEKAYDLAVRLKDRKVITVLDLCVNLFDKTGIFPGGYGVSKAVVDEVRKITPVVDAVITGSEYIRKRAMEFNANAVYLPESIDYKHFIYKKNKEDFNRQIPRAIWSGVSVKAGEVADLYPILEKRGIPLTIISNKKSDLLGPYKYIPWSYYTFPKNIVKGDFCISPRRTDNTYDLGHSHFKIGAFMAQGVPALAAPLPSYKEVIGKTGGGRICDSDLQWEEALDEVLENREMLWEWSQAAHDGMDYYSTENIAKIYVETFEKLISGEEVVSI
jgi:hypothetical protein|tara:strand:- start:22 stop:1059 length:1038 start_codon:yes stop_codon:yes gene_type:complete